MLHQMFHKLYLSREIHEFQTRLFNLIFLYECISAKLPGQRIAAKSAL